MIPFHNFQNEPVDLITREISAASRVIRSGSYILGTELNNFESNWAGYCGAEYAIGVANGMDAIEIGLRSIGIQPGDEVITTAMTAFATILAISKVGAVPVFADIEPDTGLLSIESSMRCVNEKTKAVLLVHLYGHMNELSRWKKECLKRDIFLLEDCAQSHGAKWDGIAGGGFGEWGAYSFYPTKNLGAIGDAGAIVTNSIAIDQTSRVLRNYGQSERYCHSMLGLNSRLDEIQAAILIERLGFLDWFIKRRRDIAELYQNNLSNHLIESMATSKYLENHVYHLYVVLSPKRNQLATYLQENGITTLIHYPTPAHLQPADFEFRIGPGGLSCAEKHAELCLSLPCNPQMSDQDVWYVIDKVNNFI